MGIARHMLKHNLQMKVPPHRVRLAQRITEESRLRGRGSVCWGRLDPDLRVSKCSPSGPRTASRTAGNRRRGASGKPACAKGESDWRKRLAEARAIDEARELERRGLTLAPGRGC